MFRIAVIAPDPFLRILIDHSLSSLDADVAAFARWNDRMIPQLSECNLILTLSVRPLLCGHDIAARIRRQNQRRTQIYVLSWLHNEQNVLSLLESGVDQYFTLPVNIPRLRGKIAAQIEFERYHD